MLKAIARALASLRKFTGEFLGDMYQMTVEIAQGTWYHTCAGVADVCEWTGKSLQWAGSKLGGGGGSAPARDMSKLPTASELRDVQEAAVRREAARAVAADTAIAQVRRFAEADGPVRLTMPLTKLTADQATWLVKLNENEYDRLLNAEDGRIQAALDGKPGIIEGLRSVGEKPERLSPLGKRIMEYRDRQVELDLDEWRASREVDHIRAA